MPATFYGVTRPNQILMRIFSWVIYVPIMAAICCGVTRLNHIFMCISSWGTMSQFSSYSAVRGVTRSHHFQLCAWVNTSQICVWLLWIVVFIEGCTCVETCGLDRRDKYAHHVWSFSAWRNVYVGPDKGRCVHEKSSSSSLGNVYNSSANDRGRPATKNFTLLLDASCRMISCNASFACYWNWPRHSLL